MINKWIESESDELELLPLCHTTRWKHFKEICAKDIIENNSLFPPRQDLKIPQEQVAYFFYGVPYYIYKFGKGKSINIEWTDDMPIAILLRPEAIVHFDQAYPFDTGAFFNNRLDKFFGISFNEINFFKLVIDEGLEIRKFIKRYHEKNEHYCGRNFRFSGNEFDSKEEKLISFFKNESASELDLRVKALELQIKKPINMNLNLEKVVLPKHRSERYSNFKKIIKESNILYYRDFQRLNPDTARALVMNTVLEYYQSSSHYRYDENSIK